MNSRYKIDIPSEMLETIENHSLTLGGVGTVGGLFGPGADLFVIIPAWVHMTISLADKADTYMSEQTAKKIATAVATGAGTIMAGAKAASTILSWLTAIPTFGLSLLASSIANTTLNYTFTQTYGRAVARLFLQTTEISDTETMIKILIALVGAELGFSTPHDHLIS